jgi:hypothetical protein
LKSDRAVGLACGAYAGLAKLLYVEFVLARDALYGINGIAVSLESYHLADNEDEEGDSSNNKLNW